MENYIKDHLAKLNGLNEALDHIDSSTTSEQLEELKPIALKIAEERDYIKNNYGEEDILPYKENLKKIIKQINEKFDNIVYQNKNDQTGLKKELEQLANKRILANYQR